MSLFAANSSDKMSDVLLPVTTLLRQEFITLKKKIFELHRKSLQESSDEKTNICYFLSKIVFVNTLTCLLQNFLIITLLMHKLEQILQTNWIIKLTLVLGAVSSLIVLQPIQKNIVDDDLDFQSHTPVKFLVNTTLES